MPSLPYNTDLSSLSGRDLDQICFEQGSISLHFHAQMSNPKGTGISVRSKVIHHTKNNVTEWDCSKPFAAHCSLLMLLRATLSRVTGMPNRSLKLEFVNDEIVTILSSDDHEEESYRIWDGDTLIVV